MDAVQSAATQLGRNRASVECVVSSAASDSRRLNDGGHGSTRPVCQGSQHSSRFKSVDADACHTNVSSCLASSVKFAASVGPSVVQSYSTVAHSVIVTVMFRHGGANLACLPARLLERPVA